MKLKYFFLVLTFAVAAACNSNATIAENANSETKKEVQNGSKDGAKTIKSPEAKTLLEKQKNVVILDVRTPEEYNGGHLENAVLLNKYDPDFNAKLEALDREKTYLVYCAVGGRSGEATIIMQQLGFQHLYNAAEGFNALKTAGIPVSKK